MSVCFKINLDFDRYSGQNGMLEIFRFNETLPSVSFLGKLSCLVFSCRDSINDGVSVYLYHIFGCDLVSRLGPDIQASNSQHS